MFRFTHYIIGILSTLCIALCGSCAEVDLCEVEDHPHRATLAFRFAWEDEAENRPEKMLVIANRIINTWRAGFVVEVPKTDELVTEGEVEFGELITLVEEEDMLPSEDDPTGDGEIAPGEENPGEGAGEGEDDGMDASGEGDASGEEITEGEGILGEESDTIPVTGSRMAVKGGEYQFLAINHNYDECEIERLEEFRSDVGVTARELYVKYKTNPKDSVDVGSRAWIDYNSYGFFIQSAMKPTYYAFLPKHRILSGDECEVLLSPQAITQKYTIRFQIEKEPEVKIDTIIGVLSGIPERFALTTQFVDISHTHKMVFFPEADYEGNGGQTLLECEATVNAIGLLHANNSSYNQGPGILQLCVYTSSMRDGIPVSKTIYAIINLYNTIGAARPLVMSEDGEHVQQNGREILLDISAVLRIDKDKIWENADQDNALDVWKNVRNFEIDI